MYKKFDADAFTADLRLSSLIQNPARSVDDLQEQYDTVLRSLVDKHAPLCTKSVTIHPVTPWYNEEINEAKKLRRKYEKRWRKSQLTVHREIYIEQKKTLSELINHAKTNYYTDKVMACGKDQKSLFKVINTLLSKDNSSLLPTYSSLEEAFEDFAQFWCPLTL